MTVDLSKYHLVVSKVVDTLEQGGYYYETFEHSPVRTSEEAAKIRDGYTLQQGAKALIVRVKLNKYVRKFAMLVIPGDMRFDPKKVVGIFDAEDIRFATVDEVLEITGGVQPGGVPPFGNIFGLEVVVDPSLLTNEKIVFNAGDKSFSVGMYSNDYANIVKPKIEKIV